VNFSSTEVVSRPLLDALGHSDGIPERDLIAVVRSLLQAGGDVQELDNGFRTVLEVAMTRRGRKIDQVIQLLLHSGARITQSAFAQVAEYCNLDTVDLFIKSGAHVTEEIILRAAKNEDSELFWFLLGAVEDGIKHKCKCAALGQCISDGNLDLIDKLEASGAKLNPHAMPDRIFEAAAERGDTHVLHLVLDSYSGHQSVRTSLGRALTAAILSDQNDATEMLLTAGANVNEEPLLEVDPLSAAISRKNSRLIRKLLAAGALVNKIRVIPGFGEEDYIPVVTTVLPAVVSWGDYFLIQDIINAGADVNTPGYPRGEIALAVAIQRGDASIVELLIDAGVHVSADAAPTALEVASRKNDLSMVQFLLGLGADPDEWSLVEAVSGSVELVQTILAARFGRYHRYSKGYGCRALQYAIHRKRADMIKILLANGMDANEIVKRRVSDGREPDSREPDSPKPGFPWRRPTIDFGVSAFGSAIQRDESEDLWIVQMLLNNGADPNSIVTDSFGYFDYCYDRFEKATALLEAVRSNKLAMVRKLINAGADANTGARTNISRTPLQAAAELGSIDIVHLLLNHGADVNAPPYYEYGATALQFAAIGGYTGIALLLIENGADVNASPAEIQGRTALEGAVEHGRKDMVQLLLNAGAHIIGIGGGQYGRALEFASQNGQNSICRFLEMYKDQSWESLVDWDPT
jgi:ankyrin repeat protein